MKSFNNISSNKLNENGLSVKEFSGITGIPEATVKRYCQKGKFIADIVTGNGGKQYRIIFDQLPEELQAKILAGYPEFKQPRLSQHGVGVLTSYPNPQQGDSSRSSPAVGLSFEEEWEKPYCQLTNDEKLLRDTEVIEKCKRNSRISLEMNKFPLGIDIKLLRIIEINKERRIK